MLKIWSEIQECEDTKVYVLLMEKDGVVCNTAIELDIFDKEGFEVREMLAPCMDVLLRKVYPLLDDPIEKAKFELHKLKWALENQKDHIKDLENDKEKGIGLYAPLTDEYNPEDYEK